jgi:hypothetical protein
MLMWLVEHWLLNLPGEFWIALAGVGFLAFFFAGIFSHIPPLRPYMMFVKPVGGLIILASVFMYGGTEINNIWEERVKQAQEQVAAKEREAEELNKKLEEERKKKQQVRVEYRTKIRTEIQTRKEYIDKECKFDSEVNKLHNRAAKNVVDKKPVEKVN